MNPNTKRHILQLLRDRPGEEATLWLRRAELQLQFAQAFAALRTGEDAADWTARIARGQALLDDYDGVHGIEGLVSVVHSMETELKPIGVAAKQVTIHCVGHGHIDMNWMWSWPETVATTHDTFASVLNLMEQYPELTYSQSQASVYALTERYFPEMFRAIQKRVVEGRWEVTAVHWVEGDKNLASGESIARHLLYTRRYFQEKFGLQPEDVPVDWEPDTFGHAVTIPTILAQGGVKYYYSCRTGGGFEHLRVGDSRPPLFYWQAPDGARVLVNRESTWYNSYVNIGDNIALPMVAFLRETGLHDWLNIYGIGNHGGGPTRKEVEYLRSLQEWPIYPKIVFSTATRYFRTIESQLPAKGEGAIPTLNHELNYEFTGCYTSQSAIKRGNRFGENYLEEAETLALLGARIGGISYPREQLREAWLNVLFNQFHDILPGSGVRETREHAQALFQEVGAITGAIKRNVATRLASMIDTLSLLPKTHAADEERQLVAQERVNTPFVAGTGIGAGLSGYSQANGGGKRFLPFVVYNPCAWPRSERVQVALYDTDFEAGRVVARDERGKEHPTMLLGRGGDWGHSKLTVAFDAMDVPALGYKTYLLTEGTQATPHTPAATVQHSAGEWFETPTLRFRVDRYHCGLLELIDKRTGEVLVAPGDGPLGTWQFVKETPRGMTSWVLGAEVDAPITLRAAGFHIHGTARNEGTSAPIGGPVMGYRVEWHLDVPGTQSRVQVTLSIHALEPRLDFSAEIDWREIGDPKRGIPGLAVRFPLALQNLSSRFEAPFGSVERNLFAGEEVPTLRYAYVAGTTTNGKFAGATLLQDSKYGHSICGTDLRLRIVRSSFDPDHAPEVARSTVRYALYLHDTPADPAALTRLGAAWNHPFLIAPALLQYGDAASSGSFARVATENVVLTALKQAEEGTGLVLRLVELNGTACEAVVELSPEIAGGANRAVRLDLLERPIDGTVSWDGVRLRVPMQPHSLATIRLE